MFPKLKKTLNYIKEYWFIPVAIIVVLMILLFPQRKQRLGAVIDFMHKKEKRIKEYNAKVDHDTREKIKEVEEETKNTIDEINNEYDEKKNNLESDKLKTIEDEVNKYTDSPDKLEKWFNDVL